MTWTTRADEEVGFGDLVALSVFRYADAVGKIVGTTGDDRIACRLVRGSNCRAGDSVAVEEEQFLARVFA